MDELFQEMMRTLSQAQKALQAELDLHPVARSTDMARLERLQTSAAEFADQADSLIVMLQDRAADKAVIAEAEDLCSYFESIEDGIAFRLGAGRGLG